MSAWMIVAALVAGGAVGLIGLSIFGYARARREENDGLTP